MTADTVTLWRENGDTQFSLPLNTAMTLIEVSRGRKSRAGRGALVGFGVGMVGGALLGAIAVEAPSSDCHGDPACVHPAVWGGLGGGLLGAVVGTITGVLTRTDQWEEIPLDELHVSFAPQGDGRYAFGLSVSF